MRDLFAVWTFKLSNSRNQTHHSGVSLSINEKEIHNALLCSRISCSCSGRRRSGLRWYRRCISGYCADTILRIPCATRYISHRVGHPQGIKAQVFDLDKYREKSRRCIASANGAIIYIKDNQNPLSSMSVHSHFYQPSFCHSPSYFQSTTHGN